jgi:hypothetical protein
MEDENKYQRQQYLSSSSTTDGWKPEETRNTKLFKEIIKDFTFNHKSNKINAKF